MASGLTMSAPSADEGQATFYAGACHRARLRAANPTTDI